jgi:hypothetical protein
MKEIFHMKGEMMSKFEQNYGFLIISLIYIIVFSMVLGFFIACVWLMFKGIYTIHPYIILLCIIGSIGLLGAGILSIKDWRKWRNEQGDNKENR